MTGFADPNERIAMAWDFYWEPPFSGLWLVDVGTDAHAIEAWERQRAGGVRVVFAAQTSAWR